MLPDQDLDTLIVKLSRETKDALKAMLGAYAQALLNMPMQLESLMKEYGPRVQALREKEAQLTEKALKERKLPYGQPMQGLGTSSSGYGRGRTPDYEYGPYSGYGPYYGGEGYQPYQDYRGSQPSAGESQGAEKRGGDSEKEKKEAKQDKEKEEQKKEKDIAKVTPKDKKDRTRELAKEDLKELERSLNEAQESINKHGNFLQNAPAKTKAQSAKRAETFYGDLEAITKKIDRAEEPLQFFKHDTRLLEKKEQTEFNKKFADLWQTHRSFFTTVQAQIDALQQTEIQAKRKATKGAPETTEQQAIDQKLAPQPPLKSSDTEKKEAISEDSVFQASGEDIQRLFGERPYEKELLSQDVSTQTMPLNTLAPEPAIKTSSPIKATSIPTTEIQPEAPQTPLSPLSAALRTLIQSFDAVAHIQP